MASHLGWPAPGLPPPTLAPELYSDDSASDLKHRMALWVDHESAVFGHPEESPENFSYITSRQSLLTWIGYILSKYEAPEMQAKTIVLFDVFASKLGSSWSRIVGFDVGHLKQRIPPAPVLVTLMAVIWLAMRTDATISFHDLSHKMLGTGVITGILDLAGNCEERMSVLTLLGMIDQQEAIVLDTLGIGAYVSTPVEWAHAIMMRFGSYTGPRYGAVVRTAVPHVDQWATDLLGTVSASPNFPPRSFGVTACALALVHAGVLQAHSSWHLNFLRLIGEWNHNAAVHLGVLAESALCSVNEMRLLVLDLTTAYLTATIRDTVEPAQVTATVKQSLRDQLARFSIGSGCSSASSSTALCHESAVVSTNDHASTQVMTPPITQSGGVTLLVSHFPRAALPEDLRQVFSDFDVTGIQIAIDRAGVSRCYGFVRFRDHASAVRAMDACTSKAVILNDAFGVAWTLRATWAMKEIPESFEQAHISQTGASSGTQRSKKRVPPTGLNSGIFEF